MSLVPSCYWLLLVFCITSAQQHSGSGFIDTAGSGSGSNTVQPSTSPQLPPVYQIPPVTYGNLSCGRYELKDPLCSHFMHYPVIYNHSRPDHAETLQDLQSVFGVLGSSNSIFQCSLNALLILCYFTFPFCDPSFTIPVYQPICRWDCEIMRDFVCPNEWAAMKKLEGIITFGAVDSFDCNLLPYSSGGDAPMCISTLDKGGFPGLIFGNIPAPIRSGSQCYFGKGRGYSGTLNVTQSGHTCQRWDVRYPHPHYLQGYQYPEIYGGHNYCRNPGNKGERPWCFTTNRSVRWDYCNVPKCPPSPTCQLYTGTVCRTNGSIGMDYIYIDTSIATQQVYEQKLTSVFNVLKNYPSCVAPLSSLLCHMTFPLCDLSHPTPRPHKVCHGYCQEVASHCQLFFSQLRTFLTVENLHPIIIPSDCNTNYTDSMNGGTSPECYTGVVPSGTPSTATPNTNMSCYNSTTKGINYVGVVNITSSGHSCQKWDDSAPHIHPLTSLFRRYLEGHNYCRNPEGRGLKPWCYTTNTTVRWEYCDIPSCDIDTSISPSPSVDTSPNNDPPFPLWGAGVAGGGGALILAILIAVCTILCCCCCYCTKKKVSYSLKDSVFDEGVHKQEMKSFYYNSRNPLYAKMPVNGGVSDHMTDVKLPEFSRDNLVYICDLGEGHFGLVIRAEATGLIPTEDKVTVAVKVLKEGANSSTKSEFFKEAALMAGFTHPNILRLLGVCIEQEPLCMIFEYMEMGDLNNFLRQNAPSHLHSFPCSGPKTLPERLSVKNLVDMCKDIANGLAYLSVNHYVHRDLATRNCLVSGSLKVKIADFGLSQDVYSNDYFRLGDTELLPIRWMPPEAIMHSKFTIDSDIWSYGVVLWEIFSYGIQPYFGMSNEEVIHYIRANEVLKRPQGTPMEMYDLMLDCWNGNPTDRPKAVEIAEGLATWTPEISAKIEVEAKHPDYQNMSTILEWARRSREVGQYYTLENPATTDDDTVPPPPSTDGYDHLSPPSSGTSNGGTTAPVTGTSIGTNGVVVNGGTAITVQTLYGDAPIY